MAGSRQKPGKSDTGRAKPSRAERFPVEKRLPPEKLLLMTGPSSLKMLETISVAVELTKVNQIARPLWLPKSLTREERDARILKAIELFESLKPTYGIEDMLPAQMVGAHEAAMDCLRRAMIEGQTFEVRNVNLGHAQRMKGP